MKETGVKARRRRTNSILTDDEVVLIRKRYAEGATQRELCNAYRVSINTIGRIVREETWNFTLAEQAMLGEIRVPSTPELDKAAAESQERYIRKFLKPAEKPLEPEIKVVVETQEDRQRRERVAQRFGEELEEARKPQEDLDKFIEKG